MTDAIVSHWEHRADLDRIRRELLRRGRPLDALTVEDLAPHDQLHAGGLEATRLLAEWAQVPRGTMVLDLGAGLGGSARFLAAAKDCRVLALDISPMLSAAGREITRWLRLSREVEHRVGTLETLAEGARYDLLWVQHLDIHLPHKAPFYRTLRGHTAPGGRLVWHDWLAGPGGEPHWPLPWSRDGSLSFLAQEEELRDSVAEGGWQISRLDHITERTLGWYTSLERALVRNLEKAQANAPTSEAPPEENAHRPRLGDLLTETRSVLRSLMEERLRPFFGEATLQ